MANATSLPEVVGDAGMYFDPFSEEEITNSIVKLLDEDKAIRDEKRIESKLDGRNGIFIGKNVNLSTGVWIWTEQHDINDPHFYSNETGGAVIVQDRVWISSRVTVLPKTKIYEGAVVAAGAVVTKNCEAYTIYGGIPAKKIGERSKKLFYEFTGRHEVFW